MDRNEKKRLRERIGEHLDVSGARLTDDEALQLADLVRVLLCPPKHPG